MDTISISDASKLSFRRDTGGRQGTEQETKKTNTSDTIHHQQQAIFRKCIENFDTYDIQQSQQKIALRIDRSKKAIITDR